MPAKKGRPSGVQKTDMGQPPEPVSGLGGRHVDGVDVGTLLAVDLDRDERRGEVGGAAAGSSKLSWAITWHQWHEA